MPWLVTLSFRNPIKRNPPVIINGRSFRLHPAWWWRPVLIVSTRSGIFIPYHIFKESLFLQLAATLFSMLPIGYRLVSNVPWVKRLLRIPPGAISHMHDNLMSWRRLSICDWSVIGFWLLFEAKQRGNADLPFRYLF